MARITIEDALEYVNNRFELVHLVSQRVKQFVAGATPLTSETGNKYVVTALREAALNKLRTMTPEEIEQEEAIKRAKAAEAAAKVCCNATGCVVSG